VEVWVNSQDFEPGIDCPSDSRPVSSFGGTDTRVELGICSDELSLLLEYNGLMSFTTGLGSIVPQQWCQFSGVRGRASNMVLCPNTRGIIGDSICIKSDDYELLQCGEASPSEELLEVLVFPNPSDNWITVELSNGYQIAQVQLYTRLGQLLRSYPISDIHTSVRISRQDIPGGTYVLTRQVCSSQN
jgi:hypothetical protein